MDNTKRIVNKTLLDDIADAIREKEGSSESIVASTFPERILAIETGTDMSDATATVDDILEGKTAYLSDGTKQSGTIQTWDGTIVGDFEYAYPYGDFDAIIAGTCSIYSGYCPSIIRSNAFAQASYLSDFSPYFSSNWSQIVLRANAFSNNTGIKNINFLSSSTLKILYSYALYNCANLETPAINIRPADGVQQSPFRCPKVPLFSYDINSTGTYTLNVDSFNGSLMYVSVPSGYINVSHLHGSFSSLILNASRITFSGFAPASMCTGLEKLDLSNVYFAWYASWIFYSCTLLSEVNIHFTDINPSIGFRAFQNCSNLEKISFKGGSNSYCNTIYMSDYAFASCPKLSKLDFFTSFTTIQVVCSCAFMQTGILSFSGRTIGNPVGRSFFASCSSLKYVRFSPNGTYSTRESVFLDCSNLSYVSFGRDFFEVGSSAFAGCSVLPSMALGRIDTRHQDTYIHTGAFIGCNNLSKLYIFYHSETSKVTNLQHSNAFFNTPIADSSYLGYYGSIYVPDFMYSSFVTATNWTIYSDRITSFPFSEQAQLIEAYNNVSYVEVTENE